MGEIGLGEVSPAKFVPPSTARERFAWNSTAPERFASMSIALETSAATR